jgi:XTP/dITP diphosphohydrolase
MKLHLVSGNKGKIKELLQLAHMYGIDLAPFPQEATEKSRWVEKIVKSAKQTYKLCPYFDKKPLIVEDSGLFIKSLNMFPGTLSSYVYRTIGIAGILKLMEGISNREAYFKSVIALVIPEEGEVKLFSGEVSGEISREPRGSGGFGFDPIFVPRGWDKTFAEMSIDEKNSVSHRATAFRSLAQWLLKRGKDLTSAPSP